MCLFGPELANLHPNDDIAWIIYLTAKEFSRAVLCLLLAWYSPGRFLRRMACAFAVIFATQALDEAMAGNLFVKGWYEYPVAGAFLVAIGWLTKRSTRVTNERTDEVQDKLDR